MTDARTVDPATTTRAADDLEDYECVECADLAVARAQCLPCGHTGAYCGVHVAAKKRTMAFRFRANLVTPCGICGTTVEAVTWARM